MSFRTDGLNVWTDDATSLAKAAGYYAMSGPIPTTASFVWRGTDTQPGMQIVFDADGINGNGNDWNILVGETVYGDNWWLSNGSTLDRTLAPHNGGGYGSPYYGTLTEWATALPDARVLAGGFSLGSGAKGNGVIDSMTYGDTTYNFSSITPAAPVVKTVAATSAAPRRSRSARTACVSTSAASRSRTTPSSAGSSTGSSRSMATPSSTSVRASAPTTWPASTSPPGPASTASRSSRTASSSATRS